MYADNILSANFAQQPGDQFVSRSLLLCLEWQA